MIKRNDIEELEELIDLAEKVSLNFEKINVQIHSILIRIVALFIIAFFSIYLYLVFYSLQDSSFKNEYSYIEKILFPSLIVFLITCIFFFTQRYIKLQTSKRSESRILSDLLNLINPNKESVFSNTSLVKKATIEMRLNRIKFNHNSDRNKVSEKVQ